MSACFMNWPKVCSEYQRYESFQSCFRYRKTISWSGLPGIPKIGGAKENIKKRKRQIIKRKLQKKF